MSQMSEQTAEFTSLQNGAVRLGVSVDYLRDRIADGKLPAYRIPTKQRGGRMMIRVRLADLDALLTPVSAATRKRGAR